MNTPDEADRLAAELLPCCENRPTNGGAHYCHLTGARHRPAVAAALRKLIEERDASIAQVADLCRDLLARADERDTALARVAKLREALIEVRLRINSWAHPSLSALIDLSLIHI